MGVDIGDCLAGAHSSQLASNRSQRAAKKHAAKPTGEAPHKNIQTDSVALQVKRLHCPLPSTSVSCVLLLKTTSVHCRHSLQVSSKHSQLKCWTSAPSLYVLFIRDARIWAEMLHVTLLCCALRPKPLQHAKKLSIIDKPMGLQGKASAKLSAEVGAPPGRSARHVS